MISIDIEVASLAKLRKEIARFQRGIPLAIARGLNEGGDKVRTQVRRAMREQTGLVRLNSVTSRSSTMRAYTSAAPKSGIGPIGPGSLSYRIIFRGKPHTKPDEFRYSVKRGRGGGVSVKMWGVSHLFKRSFQIKGRSGASGLRMRIGNPREPIRGFDGPNLAKEAVKGQVKTSFFDGAATFVLPVVEKQIIRLLGLSR